MKKNIVIIHYNTPHLTECLVRSINLFVNDAVIYVFDNSDKDPFTAKFDNVTLFDNTKGKIIDFDKWLQKYPNRIKSNGRTNQWGSAKHCYSVEKCMDLINEDFILLDSDVLLKKDISELFDSNLIYCGEAIRQPNSDVYRVLPFICYINVNMCKENNIHYFDDNYMHGLAKTPIADRYDTGANFYLKTVNQPHKEIKCENYVVHYGHGSWDKIGDKSKYSVDKWLSINKRYWSADKNKKVVYTCITGDYDSLLEPSYVSDNFDYVCFTDNAKLRNDVWEIRPLPKETEGLSNVKKQRYVKINAHLLLKEYDISIWVDGNVSLKGDLNKLVGNTLKDDISVYVPKHPSRDCIYSEGKVVLAMHKDTSDNVNPQLERYKEEGFPEHYGLLQSNIMLRKHNNEDCIRLMDKWFDELKNGSHRDQLSFNYALWKNDDVKVFYLDKGICKSDWFFWTGKHGKIVNKPPQKSSNNSGKDINDLRKEFKKIIRNRISTYKVPIYH